MTIVICIKSVRNEFVNPNEKNNNSLTLNPYDLLTLQQFVTLKEKAEIHIICLCMGPGESEAVLTRCLALGADEAIILKSNAFSGSDTFATSLIISQALKKLGKFDLIVCGEKAVDGETGQVAYNIAKRLGITCTCGVNKIIELGEDSVTLNAYQEEYIDTKICSYPSLLIFQGFTLSEEAISLLALKRAKQKEIIEWNAEDLALDKKDCGQNGSKTKVINLERINFGRNSVHIEGSNCGKAEQLYELINNN